MNKKIWLVTGISSGLGKAIAEVAMENNDFVIGTFRNSEQADEFNSVNSTSGLGVVLDIADTDKIQALVDHLVQEFKAIDVLVNNAGFGFTGAVEATSETELRKVFDVNFFGTMALTNAVLPIMRKQRKGHIIQISSHGGVKAFAGFGAYNASKFALEGISEALAQEVASLGVRVTLVEPGPFRTSFAGDRLQTSNRVIDDYKDTANAFTEKLKSVHGKQEGDPYKAAKVIIDLADSQEPPLRLPLGNIALGSIAAKIESLKTDLERSREVAGAVVY